jgi:hypothetical protein
MVSGKEDSGFLIGILSRNSTVPEKTPVKTSNATGITKMGWRRENGEF